MARPPGDDNAPLPDDSGIPDRESGGASAEVGLTQAQREAVERALSAAVSSTHLAGSRQLRDILTYTVDKVLRSESEDIKAYSIAVDALGRDESFDPQISATVRVAAGRLRQALALHNAQYDVGSVEGEAQQDARSLEAIIHLEPGSYIPTFEFIQPDAPTKVPASAEDDLGDELLALPMLPEPPTAPAVVAAQQGNEAKPVVPWVVLPIIGALIAVMSLLTWMAVLPGQPQVAGAPEQPQQVTSEQNLPQGSPSDKSARARVKTTLITPSDTYPDWFKPREAKDAIILTAVRFDDFEFVGGSLVDQPITDDPRNADFHLQVTLYAAGDDVRGYAQLSRAATGAIVWSRLEVFEKPVSPPIRNMAELAGRRIAPLLSPYAVVQSDMVRTAPDREGVACLLKAYRYFNSESDERHKAARDCAEDLVAEGTSLPSVYAALTFLYLEEYREGRNPLPRDPLAAADRSSRLAVELGPESARAFQARMAVHKVVGDTELARRAGQRALQLNPYDTDIIADYAAFLISQGEAAEGYRMLQRAEDLFDARPAWVEVYRYLSAWLLGKDDEAHGVARFLNPSRSQMVAVVALIDAVETEDAERAAEAYDQLRRDDPTLLEDPEANLARRGFNVAVAARIAGTIREGRELAGQFDRTNSRN